MVRRLQNVCQMAHKDADAVIGWCGSIARSVDALRGNGRATAAKHGWLFDDGLVTSRYLPALISFGAGHSDEAATRSRGSCEVQLATFVVKPVALYDSGRRAVWSQLHLLSARKNNDGPSKTGVGRRTGQFA